VSRLLRDGRSLRNKRFGRIAVASGLVAASIVTLLAAVHFADRRYGLLPGHANPSSPVVAKPNLLGSIRPVDLRPESQRVADPIIESQTSGSQTLVQILLDSVPQDATIMRENREVGTTPAAVYLPRGTEVVRLAVARAGYATTSIRVIPDLDKPVLVTLRPLSSKADRPKSAGSKTSRSPRTGGRTTHQAELPLPLRSGENIRKAIPVDPFGL